MRILIVEDEYLLVSQLESIVEAAGHTVMGRAASAAHAREICRLELPDIAVIDLHLRDGFTGPDLAAELSAKGVIAWFVTANLKECKTSRSYAMGCIPKPFMDKHIRQALELSQADREGRLFPDTDPEGLILYRT